MALKKIMAFILILTLLFSLSACQQQAATGEKTGEESKQQAAAEQQTEASEQEEYVEEYEEEYYEDDEDEYYDEEYLSQDELYEELLETLTFNTVDGNYGLLAPEREIDYEAYPEKFDLRDFGVVTPVKNQSPWGTCWAFGTIAACETSILSEKQTTYKETPLDLSEHHLAWFSNLHLEDDSPQNGEGVWHDYEWTSIGAGFDYTATSLLSTGTGVTLEKDFPYRGKEGKVDGDAYSADDDWTIDMDDRFIQEYELEESRILPSTNVISEWDENSTINETALYDIKDELLAGRGVAVSYSAEDEYFNDDTWAQFCCEPKGGNHNCCIVGWDDTFSRDNFCSYSDAGETEKPEGDGAWIVKNSWGAETESFPNEGDFGIPDKNGRHTGYFYISYYDKSVEEFVTFDFLVDESDKNYYLVDQYDYLQTSTPKSSYSEDMIIMANEFEAEEDEVLRCISLESGAPGISIHYEVCKVTDPGKGPESAEPWTSGDLDYRYAGFHRIDLKKPLELKAGDHYLVTFYQTAEVGGNDVYLVSFHNDTNWKDKGADYYVKGIVNPGESWLYSDTIGRWVDWYDLVQFYHTLDDEAEFDNFSIKGYADPL